jgi:UDP-N-acetylglucosamine acyltransferase
LAATALIHPTALVDESVRLGEGVRVGPFAVIEGDVEVGADTQIGAHVVIKRYCRIGSGNRIAEHAVIGGEPQDFNFDGCVSYLEIGDRNLIREGVTIHRGCRPDTVTRIGDENFLMAYAHVAHDCRIGNRTVICNATLLAGYVTVNDRAFISGGVVLHQFCRCGRLAMIGSNAKIDQDCLPFVTVSGVPGRSRGINAIGLKRAGYGAEDVRAIKSGYQRLMSREGTLDERVRALAADSHPMVRELAAFVSGSERGFMHARAES